MPNNLQSAELIDLRGPKFFLIGTGRCGSTLLQRLLNTHPDLYVFPETHWIPILSNKFGVKRTKLKTLIATLIRTKHVTGLTTTQLPDTFIERHNLDVKYSVREFCNLVGTDLANSYQKSHWADKTPDYGAHITLLQELWPKTKFIHLVRDGVAVSKSMSHHPGFRAMVHHGRNNWVSLALDYQPIDIESEMHPRDFINLWYENLTTIEEQLMNVNPNQVIEIYFEDFLANPRNVLAKLCQFLDIKNDPDWVKRCEAKIDPARSIGRKYDYEAYFNEKQLALLNKYQPMSITHT